MADVKYIVEAPRKGEPTPHLPKNHPDFVPMPEERERRVTVDDLYEQHYAAKGMTTGAPAPSAPTAPLATTVVILNGPPGSGKDTMAKAFYDCNPQVSVNLCSFKNPMFDIALAATGLTKPEWWARYNDRKLKEEPWDRLHGLTCREFLIKISEEWIKPWAGKQAFSQLAASQVKPGINIFTDGGFEEEFAYMVDEFGRRNVKLIRLHREGYDFSKDSRDYLGEFPVETFDYQVVDGDIDGAVSFLEQALLK